MSQWSHEHPELDFDDHAEAMREEADRWRQEGSRLFPPPGAYGCSRTGRAVHVIDTGDLSGTRANCGAVLDYALPAHASLQTLGKYGLIPCANCAAILPLRRYKARA